MISNFKLTAVANEYTPTGKKITSTKYSYSLNEHAVVQITLEGDVELTIDVDAIARRLGTKAILSKSGKAVEIGGLVSARRLRVREVSRTEPAVRPLGAGYEYAK